MKGVILAAGLGTRLLPITENKPKHMIPIGGKPLILHLLAALKSNGVNELILVVRRGENSTKSLLEDGEKFGLKIEYSTQEAPVGTANAVESAKEFVGEEDFLVVYGDLLLKEGLIRRLLKSFEEHGEMVLAAIPVKDVSQYGLIKSKDGKLAGVEEKPEKVKGGGENLANAGLYVFKGREIFNAIKRTKKSRRGEYELTDSIKLLLSCGEQMRVVKGSPEEWLDIGRPWDLLEANKRVLSGIETKVLGEVSGGASLIGKVFISKGAEVKPGAVIEGPAFVGEGAKLGPNCVIRPYTSLGKNVKVGNGCEVKNSIVMDNTKISHLSYVGDSVIGENCNLGAGTKVANLRLDEGQIKMMVKRKLVPTGRRKLGAIIGDYVKTGVNVSIMPGVKIGSSSMIGPSVVVYRDVPKGTVVLLRQKLDIKKVTPASLR